MLIQRLQATQDRVQAFLPRYSHPDYLPVKIAYHTWEVPKPDLVIEPSPKVSLVPPNYLGKLYQEGAIMLRETDVLVTHISRRYTRSQLGVGVLYYLIGEQEDRYRLIALDNPSPLGWSVVLRLWNDPEEHTGITNPATQLDLGN